MEISDVPIHIIIIVQVLLYRVNVFKPREKRFHTMRDRNKRNGRKKIRSVMTNCICVYTIYSILIYYIFFQNLSTNGLILYFSMYKLPKGPPTFIACLVDVYVVHSPITFWTRGEKRAQKDLSWLLAMTHTYTIYSIHTYITYKRSITFQVCSFLLCRRFLFCPL